MRDAVLVPADTVRRQIEVILLAWGMPADQAGETAEALAAADLMGIDSHGIHLLPFYDEQRRSGMVAIAPEIRTVRDKGAVALIDGGGGFGEAPATRAIELAARKANAFGIGAVAVRNSNHYGAAGVHALRAVRHGLIGFSTSAVWNTAIVPTHGVKTMLGTNPIAFAAPARRNPPFLLDMATSTVAIGKIKLAHMAGKALPEGWVLARDGSVQTDAAAALLDRLLTPLGGDRAHGGHKGYGLAVMAEILSTVLSGSSYAPLRAAGAARYDVGHFLMAIDPDLVRDDGRFMDDLDALIDALRASPAADPERPVMVAGDPEHRSRARRETEGVPLPRPLAAAIKALCEAADAAYLLGHNET
ncbi:MAG: malate dehydrogenase [Alphaproteobacteria bacterium]|nr:MAG: malate dehydrogenase [Alphaproteobacteria bacterium]